VARALHVDTFSRPGWSITMALKAIITTLFLGSSSLAMAAPHGGAYGNEARAEHRIAAERGEIRGERRDIHMDRREIRRDPRSERRVEHGGVERRGASRRGSRR
jgi:hypothetical protein